MTALAHGAAEATHVQHVATNTVSLRTLERAKQELGVVSRREGFGPGSKVFWALPDEPEEGADLPLGRPPASTVMARRP